MTYCASNQLIFVGGIYGSGKSTLCSSLCEALPATYLSASKLASHEVKGVADHGKAVDDVLRNQLVLLQNLELARTSSQLSVLDGHYCIYNRKLAIEEIDQRVFHAMGPAALVLVDTDPVVALERLTKRESAAYKLDLLSSLRAKEIAHAKRLSNVLRVPLEIITSDEDVDRLAFRLRSHVGR